MNMKDRVARRKNKIESYDIIKRFLSKVIKTDNCWIWTGCKNSNGYARFNDGVVAKAAYIVSYEIFKFDVTQGMHIDHLCRNKICVNPKHLEEVTPQENLKRMWDHRRKNNTKIKT